MRWSEDGGISSAIPVKDTCLIHRDVRNNLISARTSNWLLLKDKSWENNAIPKYFAKRTRPRSLRLITVFYSNTMTHSKIDTWIRAGYKLLGTEGMDGIKVERLAKILALNKSGFYHYFGTMEAYVKSLLDHHVSLAKNIASEIANCQNIDPDLLLLVVKHKQFFLVESQLLVKSRPAHMDEDLDEAGRIVNEQLLPLWRKTSDIPEDASAALGFLNIIRHFFYARMDGEHIDYEFLHALAVETQDVLDKIMDRNVSTPHQQGPTS